MDSKGDGGIPDEGIGLVGKEPGSGPNYGRQRVPDQEALKRQRDRTAQTFAMDMLLLKFVQGLPLVGVLGGAGNPVYYRRVLRYVALKYRKRYLFQKREELAE